MLRYGLRTLLILLAVLPPLLWFGWNELRSVASGAGSPPGRPRMGRNGSAQAVAPRQARPVTA